MGFQPVSELQRTLRFDDYDLVSNREGLFSRRQRVRFIRSRLFDHLLGALTIAFLVAWILNQFKYSPQPEILLAGSGFILAGTLLMLLINLRPAFDKSVQVTQGKLLRHSVIPLNGLFLEEISIGATMFYIRPQEGAALHDGATYRVHYLKRPIRIGGNLLLSIEYVEPAQGEAADDFPA